MRILDVTDQLLHAQHSQHWLAAMDRDARRDPASVGMTRSEIAEYQSALERRARYLGQRLATAVAANEPELVPA